MQQSAASPRACAPACPPAQTVPEPCDPATASDVVFDGSYSVDGMGRPLSTFTWAQVGSSDIVLSGAVSAANAANTLSTAGYATWGAHLGFKWNGSTELSVRGRNLGDRTHVVYALGSTMAYLGDPRSWEIVLRKTF